ncbi:MAG: twin-arginine translocase TatA/TatE family subunit [Chloroflexi bacterium]|nr:twin-arginine translocase TatA/TatE family subunit [Chloroflexota bacterium]
MPFIGNLGPTELIIILVIALVVLGPGKLPEVGSALGKSIREFRKAATDVRDATSLEPITADAPPAPVAPVAAATAAPVATQVAPVQAMPIAAAAPIAAAVATQPVAEVPASPSGPEAPAS